MAGQDQNGRELQFPGLLLAGEWLWLSSVHLLGGQAEMGVFLLLLFPWPYLQPTSNRRWRSLSCIALSSSLPAAPPACALGTGAVTLHDLGDGAHGVPYIVLECSRGYKMWGSPLMQVSTGSAPGSHTGSDDVYALVVAIWRGCPLEPETWLRPGVYPCRAGLTGPGSRGGRA